MLNEIIHYEYSILAFCLLNHSCIPITIKYIKPKSFIGGNNQAILKSIKELSENKQPIDKMIIAKHSKVSIVDIIEIEDSETLSNCKNVEKYIDKWIELRKKYFLINANINKMAEDLTADEIKAEINSMMDFSREKIEVVNIKDAVKKTNDYILDGDTNILQTGYIALDNAVKIRSTNLIILAASPKTGKTTFALNIAKNISAKKKCLFFSFEMSIEEITKKLVGIKSHQQINNIAAFQLNSDCINDLDFNIIESSGMSIAEMKNIIIEQSPDVVFIDQLDCIPVESSGDRWDLKIGKNVVDLKNISMELRIPIFLIHQLNRDAMRQQSPQLYNLKDSSVVEQKADIVLMLWRDKTSDDPIKQKETMLKVGANRMGVECSIEYYFEYNCGIFTETEKEKSQLCPF